MPLSAFTANAAVSDDALKDTWTELPPLPVQHDDWSSCVVSADGYLYYGTNTPSFHRLPLGKR